MTETDPDKETSRSSSSWIFDALKWTVAKIIKISLIVVVSATFILTNPGKDDHNAAIFPKSEEQSIGGKISKAFARTVAFAAWQYNDYLFFSTTSYGKGVDGIISVGVLGMVFVVKDVPKI